MFYKDNDDFYKLLFWKRINHYYIIGQYSTNPKAHLCFYCITPSTIVWGVHLVLKMRQHKNNLLRDYLLSVINDEDISILESSKSYKRKLNTIQKILTGEYNLANKSFKDFVG